MKSPDPRSTGALVGLRPSTIPVAAVLWLSVLALALLGPTRELLFPSLIAYTTGFAALLLLWRGHSEFLDDPRVLLGGALLLRLTLFPTLPDLSDDLYRYVWDGWLSVSGVNPFRFLPSATELAEFQASDLFGEINSPDFHSIYPPLSQVVFLAGGLTYVLVGWPAAAFAVKAVFLLLEMSGLALLAAAIRASGLRPHAMALYALNPLILVTLTAGGHSESGMVFGLGLMAYGLTRRRKALAWVGLVLATAAKGVPLLLAPFLLRTQLREAPPRHLLSAMTPGVVLGLFLFAPFYYPGIISALASSADLYVRLFEFNAGLYFALKEIALWVTGTDWGKTIGPILGAGFLGGTALMWIRWPMREDEDFFRASLAVLGLYLLTATTVHPWYLSWGLALVPFTSFLRGAWMWASWAAFLTYFVYVGLPHSLPTAAFWGGVGFFFGREFEAQIRDRLLRIAGRRKARQVSTHLTGTLVLDLGAGEGYVATALTGRDRRCILVDVGPFFRVRNPRVVYDGLHIPVRDRSVDSVLVSLVLHHARDPEQVIREALRVTRKRVVITESTYRWQWECRLLELADRCANRLRGFTGNTSAAEPLGFRTVEDWKATFRDAGSNLILSERLNVVGHRHHLFVVEKADPI